MSNEYKPTYVDNTDNSISIMESTDTISFCKTGTKINTLSAKNVAHKKTGEDLNLCAYDGSSFNPVLTINNQHNDCRIMTNLNISGNLNIIGNGIINTSLGIGTTSLNNGFPSSNVHTNSILDINGQTTIRGHILPSINAQFDLGNAEYKIRHLFLSDNSLWIGDKHKIDVSDGTIKFRKRKTKTIPSSIDAIKGGDDDAAIQLYIKNKFEHSENPAISDIKLEEWHAYAQSKQSNIKIEEIFKPGIEGDWDENDTTMDKLVIKNNIDVSGNLNINSTGCINLPVGITSSRPSNPIPGTIRYNSETYNFEGYSGWNGGVWISIGILPNPYNTDDFRYYMWEADNSTDAGIARGDRAYGMIGNKRHETQADGTILANQGLHVEGTGIHQQGYVYSTIPPDKQGQYGIDHTDNTITPDEHLWKITFDSEVNGIPYYNIVNTAFNSEITNYGLNVSNVTNDYRVVILPAPGSPVGQYWTIALVTATATVLNVPDNSNTYTGTDWNDGTYIAYDRMSFSFKLL